MRSLHRPSMVLAATLALVTGLYAQSPPAPGVCALGTFVKQTAANPVISPDPSATFPDPMTGQSVVWRQDHTFNPAAGVLGNKICVIFRAEDDSGHTIGGHTSRLGMAESADGVHFTIAPAPVLYPDNDSQKADEWPGGCEDPRLVETDDGGYLLTYTQWNRKIARLAVAKSRDLVHWDKQGPAFAAADNERFADMYCKSGAILTRLRGDHLVAVKVNGLYWMYWGEGTVHAATSTDLIHWDPVLGPDGNILPLLSPRAGKFDSTLAEGGPPAILMADKIVVLYNGKNADNTKNGDPSIPTGAYCAGQALFDPAQPTHLLARTDTPFLEPTEPYEVTGQYKAGTVFIEGLAHFHAHWWLYYGTADSYVAAACATDDGK